MADKKFEEHMMYGDGKARKAETHAEHLKLKNKGWGHKKPSGFKMKGYSYAGKSPMKGGWWAQQTKGHGGPSRSGESPMMKKGPCWKGYEMIGMKKKGGKNVPNCVPKKKKK